MPIEGLPELPGKFAASVRIGPKGQIVIPAKIRARHGLTPGTQLEFVDAHDGIRLVVRRKVGIAQRQGDQRRVQMQISRVNKSERHIRGGMATREKYLHQMQNGIK